MEQNDIDAAYSPTPRDDYIRLLFFFAIRCVLFDGRLAEKITLEILSLKINLN